MVLFYKDDVVASSKYIYIYIRVCNVFVPRYSKPSLPNYELRFFPSFRIFLTFFRASYNASNDNSLYLIIVNTSFLLRLLPFFFVIRTLNKRKKIRPITMFYSIDKGHEYKHIKLQLSFEKNTVMNYLFYSSNKS